MNIEAFLNDPNKSFKLLQRITASFCLFIPFLLFLADSGKYDKVIIGYKQIHKIPTCSNITNTTNTTQRIISKTNDTNNKGNFLRVISTDSKCLDTTLLFEARELQTDVWGFRKSISHYSDSPKGYLLGLFYGIAAMLLIANCFVYLSWSKWLQPFTQIKMNLKGPWYNAVTGFMLIMVVVFPLSENKVKEMLHYVFTFGFFISAIASIAFGFNQMEYPIKKWLRYGLAIFILVSVISLGLAKCILWGEWLALIGIAVHLYLSAKETDRLLKNLNKV